MENLWVLETTGEDATRRLGSQLGRLLEAGDVVLLDGPLGAGKTHFAQGVGRGLSVAQAITSPTFTMVAEYDGRLPFVHMDLYRLYASADALGPASQLSEATLERIAFDDYLDGGVVLLIEWPQGIREKLDEYIELTLAYEPNRSEEVRSIRVSAVGASALRRVRDWMMVWGTLR